MHPSALLFDLDGTLADTHSDLHATMNVILARYGCPNVATDRVRHMIGFAVHDFAISDTQLDEATEQFVDYYDQHIDDYTTVFDGVREILENAKAQNMRLAVITNKRESLAAKLLFRLDLHQFFDLLIGGDTLVARKPDPLPITSALERLGVDRSRHRKRARRKRRLYLREFRISPRLARGARRRCHYRCL
jgi:HAD superfamily hydrolase (TIGR01549 family)